jgi:multicomponent Na+:H+ antiporter subunit D
MWTWPHWLPAIVAAPIVGGVLVPALAMRGRRWAPGWSLLVLSFTLLGALALTLQVARGGPVSYDMGGWARPYGIELRFDEVSAFALAIALVGWLAVLFSFRYAPRAIPWERLPYYYTLLLLNLGGMIGFVVTGDLFNLFVFLEVLSLSAYALVAVSRGKVAGLASMKYLLMGAVSSVVVLLCVGILYSLTGSLNMADVALRLAETSSPLPLALALGGFTAAFMVKAALFPLHTWLPDAHAAAPSPVSAILSGLVVKMGIIGLIRVLQIFHTSGGLDLGYLHLALMWLGAASLIMGAVFAIVQEDLKQMLAYSTVSNVGYIVLGLGLASSTAVSGALVHVLNHAVIKSCLFLAAGALILGTGQRTLTGLQGVGRTMPVTCVALSIGILAIIGVPPTGGFPGKWTMAVGAVEAGRPGFAVVLVLGALLLVIYYARIVNAFYFRPPVHPEVEGARDGVPSILVPVLTLAALSLLAGILGRVPLEFVEPAAMRLVGP